jgi:hypothetical protein
MPYNISKYFGLIVLRAKSKIDNRHKSDRDHIKYLKFRIQFTRNTDNLRVECAWILRKILNIFGYEKSILKSTCIFCALAFR